MGRVGGALQSAALVDVLVFDQTVVPQATATDSASALTALGTLTDQPATNASSYDRNLTGKAWTYNNDEADGHDGRDTRNDILHRGLSVILLNGKSASCSTFVYAGLSTA